MGVAAASRARVRGQRSPINPETLADLRPTGRLGRQAGQLVGDTDVPLTLAPSPETLDAWAALGQKLPDLAAGADAVRASAAQGNKQVLAGPFVPLDLPVDRARQSPGRRHPRRRDAPRRAHARAGGARTVPGRARRSEHGAPWPSRRRVARHPPERQRPPARGRRQRADPGQREVHPRAPLQDADRRWRRRQRDDRARDRRRPRAVPHRRRPACIARRAPARRTRARSRRATEHPARRRHRQPRAMGRRSDPGQRGARGAARQPAVARHDRGGPAASRSCRDRGRRFRRDTGVPPARVLLAAEAAGHDAAVRRRGDEPERGRRAREVAERPARPERRPRVGHFRGGRMVESRRAGSAPATCSGRSAPPSRATSVRSTCSRPAR